MVKYNEMRKFNYVIGILRDNVKYLNKMDKYRILDKPLNDKKIEFEAAIKILQKSEYKYKVEYTD